MAGGVKLLAIAVALSPLALASAIAPAWAEDVDYLKRFSSSDVTMVANKDTLLSAAEIGVYQFGSVDNVVSLKRAKLESVDGLIVNISEGFYYPRLSLLSVPDGVSLQMAQPRFGSLR